jgi:L-gulonate 5-dehydrogenase
MRAALLTGPRTVEVVRLPRPEPSPGRAVIRVEANTFCGSDLKAYRGTYRRGRFPTLLGHEFSGTVAEVGDGVDPDLVGSRVCAEPNVSCGRCRYCAVGLHNLCPDYHLLGESLDYPGACAEFVTVAAGQLHPLPPSVSTVEGALVQPLAIAYEGIVNRAAVTAGEAVLVLGAGPIGLGVMLLARLWGARVMVADILPGRLDRAAALGAERTVRIGADDLDRAVAVWTDGAGVDVAVEAVGGAQDQSLRDAQRMTAPRGRILVLGGFSAAETPFAVSDLKNREQTLVGSLGHPGTFAPVIEMIAGDRIRPAGMVTHTIGLDEVGDALESLHRHGEEMLKVLLKP